MISDISSLKPFLQRLVDAAVLHCKSLVENEKMTVKDAVNQVVEMYKNLSSDPSFPSMLNKILYEEVTQVGNKGTVISRKEIRNKNWWTELKIKKPYWERYKKYLELKPGWGITAVEDLNDSTDKVMNLISDPTTGEKSERIGLVYGDVQSGKTAHYIGLINKAYSAGYKIIIVLTGMHNSLRSQTQTRIDEEFLGYETSTEESDIQKKNLIGVGLITDNREVGPLTSITNRDEKGDFCLGSSKGQIVPPYIIVTKKNYSVLDLLIEWLSSSTIATLDKTKKVIGAEYPALIIDDEADQASINTNDPLKKKSPSSINGYIRKLLNLFECRSYVGYTATPFANIFIPKSKDNPSDEFGDDLFPRDFIVKAPRPNLYIGAKEFFGLGDGIDYKNMPLLRTIFSEQGSKFGHKPKNGEHITSISEIPEELKTAIMSFYIAVAVRNIRGQINKPNTMLVHVERLVYQQINIKMVLEQTYKDPLDAQIKFNDKEIKEKFRSLYQNDFKKTNEEMCSYFSFYSKDCRFISFDDLWKEIKRIASDSKQKIKVKSINGKSDDSLVYKKHEGKPYNVIVIGGDKLSRGLTLEGLSISYFTRGSSMMDTLMQMGRWFGYRNGYIDVCRIFSTEDLLKKFRQISYSIANLSQQFDDMDDLETDPAHFGLKVATNPDILISSKNKIRSATEFQSDFSSKLAQTRIIDTSKEIVEKNYQAVDRFLCSIEKYKLNENSEKEKRPNDANKEGKYFWIGVKSSYVIDFFRNYKTSKHATRVSSTYIAEYIEEMNRCGGLVEWTVCLNGLSKNKKTEPYESIIANNSITVYGVLRNRENCEQEVISEEDYCDLGAIISGDDAELDFTESQSVRASEIRERLKGQADNTDNKNTVISRTIRKEVRPFEHGFLILYPIGWAQSNLKTEQGKAPYGFAVVFPDRQNKGKLQSYMFNQVAMEELDDEE